MNTFDIFNGGTKLALLWLGIFTLITVLKIIIKYRQLDSKKDLIAEKENLILEELPGFLFIFLHTIAFYYAGNTLEKSLFAYWGPGYFVVAAMVLSKYPFKWKHIAIPSSYACKLMYLAMVIIFMSKGMWLPIYGYSVWIMLDQVRLAWFKNNGDRTRRIFEDYWIPRILYLAFLFIPFFKEDFMYRELTIGLSSVITLFWGWGIYRLVKKGIFFKQPKIEGFGRDIVYL